VYAGIKPTVISGSVSVTVPTSVDTDGTMNYSNATNKIRNRNTGFVGASVDYAPKRNHAVSLSAIYGQDGAGRIGVNYKLALQ
jgi:hypothetical protein